MTMDWIRRTRGVPAKRGGRVIYTAHKNGPKAGVITSASHGYLRIRLDGEKYSKHYHPTWKLNYLDDSGRVIFDSDEVADRWKRKREQREQPKQKVDCSECGLCCRKMIVEVRRSDIDREPKLAEFSTPLRPFLDRDFDDQLHQLTCGKACPMIDSANRCAIYETRPTVCREFAAGGERCLELRAECGVDS